MCHLGSARLPKPQIQSPATFSMPCGDDELGCGVRTFAVRDNFAEARSALTVPADASDAATLAPRYANEELGEIVVRREGASVIFDFGEWKSEVGSRRGPDGSASFRAVDAGYVAFELELTAGLADGKRTLRVRDEPYEYTFTEK